MGLLSQIRETKRQVYLALGNAEAFYDSPTELIDGLLKEIKKIEELKSSGIQKNVESAKINFEKYIKYAKMHQNQREAFMMHDDPSVKNHLDFCTATIRNIAEAETKCAQFIENVEEAKENYLKKHKHLMTLLD